VELKCFIVLEVFFWKLFSMGRPVFPFIDQGKDLGYTREREKKVEKKKEKN
jgi:hypothetical protein